MRVRANTIDDFIENLKRAEENVVGGVVWVERTENPMDGDRRNAVRFRVDLHASAVVRFGEEGEYLLECGEHCGIDYRDATADRGGSDRAAELRERLEEYCCNRPLELRPGMIDM